MFYKIILFSVSVLLFSCSVDKKKEKQDNLSGDSIVFDIDGNVYHVIKIGKQIWLKENLKVTHFQNGEPIPNLKNQFEWNNDTIGAYCDYNNDTALATIYGRLYNWYAVNDLRNICPKGWRIAGWRDFDELNYFLGGTLVSGGLMKERGTAHWRPPNDDATNASGFTALPSGHRDEHGFSRLGRYAYFWNKEEYTGKNCFWDGACAYECSLVHNGSYFNHDWGLKKRGMAVRCIKIDTVPKKCVKRVFIILVNKKNK